MRLIAPLAASIDTPLRAIRYALSALSFAFAMLTIGIILSCESRPGRAYSRLLLGVVIVSLLSDMHAQLVFDPFYFFPVPCVVRYDPLINLPGRTSIHYIAYNMIFSSVAPLFTACFFYRHQAVMMPGSRWAFRPGAQLMLPLIYAPLIIALPPLLLIMSFDYCSTLYDLREPFFTDIGFSLSAKGPFQMLSPDWSEDILARTDCFDTQGFTNITILYVVFIYLYFSISVATVYHTFESLRKHISMSETMKAYHRTMTKSLVLQTGVPFIVSVFPICMIIYVYLLNIDSPMIIPTCKSIVSAHSFVHSISVLLTTPVYRKMIMYRIFRTKKPVVVVSTVYNVVV